MQYLKFFLMIPVLLATSAGIALGGIWMWFGVALCLTLVVGGDAIFPDDYSAPQYQRPGILDAVLYSTLPFILVMMILLVWMAAPGDPLTLGATLKAWFGWDMAAWKERTTVLDIAGGILSASLIIGTAATNVAHELMHRPNLAAIRMARWLLAFSYDIPLVLSHVYGHHVLVGTAKDHTTARRGEASYAFILRSTFAGQANAWRIEAARLRADGHGAWSWRNYCLRGYVMSLALTVGAYVIGGWRGALVFAICGAISKSLLELINYIQHYGLLRAPNAPIALRHSWNSNKPISSHLLCNVTRHPHHHIVSDAPYWSLLPNRELPALRYGYLTSIIIALVPPLWHWHMAPLLLQWDMHTATPEERSLAQEANRRSGVPRLMARANDGRSSPVTLYQQ